MVEQVIQAQIDTLNQKMDIILEEVYAQKEARESLQDLMDDLSLVSKDVFKNTVIELDRAGCEFNPEAVYGLGLRLLRNLGNINLMIETLESVNDFLKDAVPVFRQMGLDAIQKMNELEKRGYIDFFRELSKVLDNIITNFSPQDVRNFANNIVTILETVKSLTQPDMLQAVNNAVIVYKNLDTTNLPEYSLLKALRELRTPEMKRGLGFIITFLKNLAATQQIQNSDK